MLVSWTMGQKRRGAYWRIYGICDLENARSLTNLAQRIFGHFEAVEDDDGARADLQLEDVSVGLAQLLEDLVGRSADERQVAHERQAVRTGQFFESIWDWNFFARIKEALEEPYEERRQHGVLDERPEG